MSAIAWDLYPKEVFRWVSFGTTATPSTATVKRPHWQAHGLSAFNDVFVWDSKGVAGGGSIPGRDGLGGDDVPRVEVWEYRNPTTKTATVLVAEMLEAVAEKTTEVQDYTQLSAALGTAKAIKLRRARDDDDDQIIFLLLQ